MYGTLLPGQVSCSNIEVSNVCPYLRKPLFTETFWHLEEERDYLLLYRRFFSDLCHLAIAFSLINIMKSSKLYVNVHKV